MQIRPLSKIVPVVVLLLSCSLTNFLVPTEPTSTQTGTLDVTIIYDDVFYVEVFDYAPDAPNIRHYVLVMPESEVDRDRPGSIFTSLAFPTQPGQIVMRDDRAENSWALDYLYEAPAGQFTGQFAPGRYFVATAFIAAALSPEEAGVPDGVILFAGVTGGGASTDYREVIIEPSGGMIVNFNMTDADGWG